MKLNNTNTSYFSPIGHKLHFASPITVLLLMLMLFTAYSCSNNQDEDTIKNSATTFANAYFNNKYAVALHNSTAESEKWIRYVAGNLTQEDLDKINACEDTAECTVTDLQQISDTTAQATLEVTNAFLPDSIGKAGHMIDKGKVKLTLRKRDGQWSVHLDNVPQILATSK